MSHHLEVSRKKCHLDVALVENHKVYYREGNGASSPRDVGYVKFLLEVVLIKSTASFAFNLHYLPSFLGCVD